MAPPLLAAVLTADQRGSRASADMVPRLAQELNEQLADGLAIPFSRTVGDELQGVLVDLNQVSAAATTIFETGSWSLGIGIGIVDELGLESRDSRGEAFVLARQALDESRAGLKARGSARRSWPVRVLCASGAEAGDQLEYCLAVLHAFSTARKPQTRRVLRLARQGLSQAEMVERLQVSQPHISMTLTRGRWAHELAVHQLARHFVAHVVEEEQ